MINELEIKQSASHKSEEEMANFARQTHINFCELNSYIQRKTNMKLQLSIFNHKAYGFKNNIIDNNGNIIIDKNSKKYKEWQDNAPYSDYNVYYEPYQIDDKIYNCKIIMLLEDYQRYVPNDGNSNVPASTEALKQNIKDRVEDLMNILDQIELDIDKDTLTLSECIKLYTHKILYATTNVNNTEIKQQIYVFDVQDTIKNNTRSRDELLYMKIKYMIYVIKNNIKDIDNMGNKDKFNKRDEETNDPILSNNAKEASVSIKDNKIIDIRFFQFIYLLLSIFFDKNSSPTKLLEQSSILVS